MPDRLPPTFSSLLLPLFLVMLLPGCGGPKGGPAVVEDGDPTIERITGGQNTEVPPHLLVCGFNKVLTPPFEVRTYLEDGQGALSLYDFMHSDAQLRTWMEMHPGGKAYGYRKVDPEAGERSGIGRKISEPCFGNGDQATEVIRQIIVVRAAGATPSEALHNLLRQDQTAHFVISRDGTVYQALDPVHAPMGYGKHNNFAIVVALQAPRRLDEWLPSIVAKGAARGFSGMLAHVAAAPSGERLALGAPDDAFAERRNCSVRGKAVPSETYTPEQLAILRTLTQELTEEYPELTSEYPLEPDGSPLAGVMEEALYHKGVLAEFNLPDGGVEPACLDLSLVYD